MHLDDVFFFITLFCVCVSGKWPWSSGALVQMEGFGGPDRGYIPDSSLCRPHHRAHQTNHLSRQRLAGLPLHTVSHFLQTCLSDCLSMFTQAFFGPDVPIITSKPQAVGVCLSQMWRVFENIRQYSAIYQFLLCWILLLWLGVHLNLSHFDFFWLGGKKPPKWSLFKRMCFSFIISQ